jgi:GT2 family glycosyltransferase
LRLKKNGGKIYLFPDIVSYYYIRSDLKDFLIHNFKDGIWAVYPLKFVRIPFKPRHYVPLAFVLSLIFLFLLGLFLKPFIYIFWAAIILYLCVLLYAGIKVSLKEKDATYLFSLPVALAARHFAYGFGSAFGIIKLLK